MELIEPAYVGVDEPLGRWLTLYKLDLEVAVQKIFRIERRSVARQDVFFMLFCRTFAMRACVYVGAIFHVSNANRVGPPLAILC